MGFFENMRVHFTTQRKSVRNFNLGFLVCTRVRYNLAKDFSPIRQSKIVKETIRKLISKQELPLTPQSRVITTPGSFVQLVHQKRKLGQS